VSSKPSHPHITNSPYDAQPAHPRHRTYRCHLLRSSTCAVWRLANSFVTWPTLALWPRSQRLSKPQHPAWSRSRSEPKISLERCRHGGCFMLQRSCAGDERCLPRRMAGGVSPHPPTVTCVSIKPRASAETPWRSSFSFSFSFLPSFRRRLFYSRRVFVVKPSSRNPRPSTFNFQTLSSCD